MPSRFREVWSGEWDLSDVQTPTVASPAETPSLEPSGDDHRTVWLYQQTRPGANPELVPKPSKSGRLQKRPPTASQRLVKRRGRPSDAGTPVGSTDGGTYAASSTAVRSDDSGSRREPSMLSHSSSKRLRKRPTDETIIAQQHSTPPQVAPAGPVEEVRRSDTTGTSTGTGQDSPLLHKPDRPRVVSSDPRGLEGEPAHRRQESEQLNLDALREDNNSTPQPPAPELTAVYQAYRPPPPSGAAPSSVEALATARTRTTTNTTYDREVLPPVIHETRRKEIRHIHHDMLTRSIHEHDIFHRVLPIIEIDKRATRHFFRAADGSLVEIEAPAARDWRPSPAVAPPAIDPRDPSRRRISADERRAEEEADGDGPVQTHRTHVHPARLGDGRSVEIPESAERIDAHVQTAPAAEADIEGETVPRESVDVVPPAPPPHREGARTVRVDEESAPWPPSGAAAKGKAPALTAPAQSTPGTKHKGTESPTLWPPARPRSKGNVGRRSVPRRPGDVVWWEVRADA